MNAIAKYDSAAYEKMGAPMLSQQPSSLKQPPKEGKDWTRIYQHVSSRLEALRLWRYSWWVHWSQLAQFIDPKRYSWLCTPNKLWKGNQLNQSIIDGTATLAMQICAAGLWTGLTSPSRPWFNLGSALPWVDIDADGKAWLEDTSQRILTVLAQSNYYTTRAQGFQDVTTFGQAPTIIYEDDEDIIRCYLPCAGEYYLGVGPRLSTDTFAREFVLNVEQIVGMFSVAKCPEEVRKLWTEGGGSWQTEFVVAHLIEPNAPIASQSTGGADIYPVPQAFVYREFYWLRSNKTKSELSRRGFHELPFTTSPWSRVSNDAYGRSPGMNALGDIKQLQVATLRQAEFIEKLIRPPMGADVALKNEPASILPANITFMDTSQGKKSFFPLFEVPAAALAPITQSIEKISARIKDYFFVNIFMAISQMEGVQPRNELELTQRDLERLQVLGPFITLFETETAAVDIKRVFAILQRRRMLKPMPESLKGVPLKINYISILKLAQRAAQSVALKQVLATAGAVSSAAKAAGVPDPIRILNLDEAMREIVDMANVNPKVVFTPDEVGQHDEARQKVKQGEQLAAATLPATQAAKNLSDTEVGGGQNALAAILGRSQTV